MPFYKKRPVIIEAQEWDGTDESANEIIAWGAWNNIMIQFHARLQGDEHISPAFLTIDTLEGTMTAQVGDFIIKGVQGEFYPCKPDIFHKTYERM